MTYREVRDPERDWRKFDWRTGELTGVIDQSAVDEINRLANDSLKNSVRSRELYDQVRVEIESLKAESEINDRAIRQVLADEFGCDFYDVVISFISCEYSPVGVCVYVDLDDDVDPETCRFCSLPKERK